MIGIISISNLFSFMCIVSHAQEFGSFTDPINNKTYKTVKIGTQIWMAENLSAEKFSNGDPIPLAETDADWKKAAKEGKAAWCFYNNAYSYGDQYGKLYNGFTITDSRNVCPAGWHVPTNEEWKTLENYVGGSVVGGIKMKAVAGWNAVGGATNSSGFSALPGGIRFNISQFVYMGRNGYWWSSTPHGSGKAWSRFLSDADTFIYLRSFHKKSGLSVRCIKN
jgi:uncharacterized protein (TIGR02145 family)